MKAGRELDALVGRAMGFEPVVIHIVTSDGGESAAATVNRDHGPWHSERQLRKWLEAQHKNDLMLDYVLDTWETWPRFSTDISAAMEVAEKVIEDTRFAFKCGYGLGLTGEARWWALFGDNEGSAAADTLPLAISLAALEAVGVEAPS